MTDIISEDTHPEAPRVRISVTMDVPDHFRPKAQYALGALLTGIGVDVVPTGGEVARLHYGPTADGADVHLAASPDAPRMLAEVRDNWRPPVEVLTTPAGTLAAPFVTPAGPDLVATAFYWLSGWDEYCRGDRDEHGRVTWSGSIQESVGRRAEPYVDVCRAALVEALSGAGIGVPTAHRRWSFCVTHDIDYMRKWTPGIVARTAKRAVLDPAFRRRLRLRRNPIREASYRMLEAVRSRGGRSTWFFKAGGGDVRDVRYALEGRAAQRLLQAVRDSAMEIGLHPSYHAFRDATRLSVERERLERASGFPVRSSRQHYLRTDLPHSARTLVDAGMTVDATLGFPDAPGYRNGTTHPFRVFDVQRNRALPLVAVPLAFMDASLFNRQSLSIDDAVGESVRCMEDARRHGGVCAGLWHNVLWDEADYPGWGEHFERCVAAAVERGARLVTVAEAVRAQSPSSESIRAMFA